MSWATDAACRGHNPDWWETHNPNHPATRNNAKAVAICKTCPVSTACLAETLRVEEGLAGAGRYGIYGGLTGQQRARLGRAS